jgi:hypothetical protein
MIEGFNRLKTSYASKEVSLERLKAMEAGGLVRFENRGISRSQRDCLQCEIIFSALSHLPGEIVGKRFDSADALRSVVGEDVEATERFSVYLRVQH